MIKKYSFLCFSILLLLACSDTRPFIRDEMQGDPSERPHGSQIITFYALGDWGTGDEQQMAVAEALRKNVAEIPEGREIAPFVLGLGDNIYNKGLPDGWNNPVAYELLEETFGRIYHEVEYEGKELVYYMIPGNHDHAGKAGGKNGWGDVIHQETTAEKLYEPYWQYYPIDPDKNADTNDSTDYNNLKMENIFSLTLPEKINASNSKTIAFTAVDSQVLLELYQRKDFEMLQKHWDRLESLLADSVDWKVILGHHPIRSHGQHGGFRSWYWWLPPVFLYTVIDKWIYKRLQDLDHPANVRFQKDLLAIMKKLNVHIYLSGHEHNIQFLKIDKKNFQIISGSAAKLSPVTHKDDTLFSHASPGFARFDVSSQEMWVEFFQVDVESSTYKSSALFKITK
ncbi:MAG: metallophosphoesterase [bacterium]